MKLLVTILMALFVSLHTISASSILEKIQPISVLKFRPIADHNIAEIYGGLSQSIDEFLQSKIEAVNEQISSFNSFSAQAKSKVSRYQNGGELQIQTHCRALSTKIFDLKKHGEVQAQCAGQYETAVLKGRSLTVGSTKDYISNVAIAFLDFTTEVSSEMLELCSNVGELTLIVKECYNQNGYFDVAQCAFSKIKDIKDLIPRIADGIKATVATAIRKFKCVWDALKNTQQSEGIQSRSMTLDFVPQIEKCYSIM